MRLRSRAADPMHTRLDIEFLIEWMLGIVHLYISVCNEKLISLVVYSALKA